ncbi:unnamed protein product [Meloidogyne enterolobii]|uniref:Uncharacterized protein n=1 Tax=Meloidogyne enterolobii TaxID=390850 RepID=A0ACB1AA26_MELEN
MIKETKGESSTEESLTEDNQSGSGTRKKRVLVKVAPINSPGLIRRKNKFMPKIWEKL